jgi:hypothetical protein
MTTSVDVDRFFLRVENSIIKYFCENPKFKDEISCTAK